MSAKAQVSNDGEGKLGEYIDFAMGTYGKLGVLDSPTSTIWVVALVRNWGWVPRWFREVPYKWVGQKTSMIWWYHTKDGSCASTKMFNEAAIE